jgi:type IV secretory pathway VirB10-like protein
MLLALFSLILVASGACGIAEEEPSEAEAVDVAEIAAAQALAEAQQREAAAAEAEAEAQAARERLEAAERELAEQEAAQAEREREFREQQAAEEEKARLAAARAEAEERERMLAEREREIAQREARAAAEEEELRRSAEAAEQAPGDDEGFESEPEGVTLEEPEAAPEPDYVEATLRPGTILEIEMVETLSSETSRVGDTFSARLARDIFTDEGILAVPAGSEIRGEVIEVTPLKRIGGQASLGVAFTELVPPIGPPIGLKASFAELGQDRRGEKKKIIGAAIAGAILGRVLGGKGAGEVLAGAAVGAAAGTAVVGARADGKDAVIPAGEVVGLVLEEVVTVTTEMTGVVDD